MNLDEIKTCVSSLTQSVPVTYLATIDAQGLPEIRAMLNLRHEESLPALKEFFAGIDPFTVYLTTGLESPKIQQVRTNPKASVYYCDMQQIRGAMLSGTIEQVTDRSITDALWQDDWAMYYPGGKDGPEYGVLRLKPVLVKGWNTTEPFEYTLKP